MSFGLENVANVILYLNLILILNLNVNVNVKVMYMGKTNLNSEWSGSLQPYGPLSLDPSCQALHYGCSIFEGTHLTFS